MKTIILGILLLAITAGFTGCGTLHARVNQQAVVYPAIYPGVRQDWVDMRAPKSDTTGSGTRTLAALDLPFSAFADTFLLPLDALFLLFDR
jgi:uncharacterized protein YceK